VDPSPENIARIKSALAVLPDNAAAQIEDEDVAKYQVVRIADEVVIDLLAAACEVSYDEAVQGARRVEVAGASIPVADKRTLIRTKQTYRPSDEMDRAYLEMRIAEDEQG
jgi:hypothetical protein